MPTRKRKQPATPSSGLKRGRQRVEGREKLNEKQTLAIAEKLQGKPGLQRISVCFGDHTGECVGDDCKKRVTVKFYKFDENAHFFLVDIASSGPVVPTGEDGDDFLVEQIKQVVLEKFFAFCSVEDALPAVQKVLPLKCFFFMDMDRVKRLLPRAMQEAKSQATGAQQHVASASDLLRETNATLNRFTNTFANAIQGNASAIHGNANAIQGLTSNVESLTSSCNRNASAIQVLTPKVESNTSAIKSHDDRLSILERAMMPRQPTRRNSMTARRNSLNKCRVMLSSEEEEIITEYVHGSNKFNLPLRSGMEDPEEEKRIDLLIQALNKLPPYGGVVYRFLDLTVGEIKRMRRASRFTEHGFLSSWTEHFNAETASHCRYKQMNCRFEIVSKTGRSIVHYTGGNERENEVLFKPGTKFRVLSTKQEGDKHIFGLEEWD